MNEAPKDPNGYNPLEYTPSITPSEVADFQKHHKAKLARINEQDTQREFLRYGNPAIGA